MIISRGGNDASALCMTAVRFVLVTNRRPNIKKKKGERKSTTRVEERIMAEKHPLKFLQFLRWIYGLSAGGYMRVLVCF